MKQILPLFLLITLLNCFVSCKTNKETPYGVSHVAGHDGNPALTAEEETLAFAQGQRLARLALQLNRP